MIILGAMRADSTILGQGGISISHSVVLFVIPWTIACQAPLSTEFSRQEYWSGLPFPSPFGQEGITLLAFSDLQV